ncbi:MAG: Imm53 family immunity protein, partial [Bacteroidota bacterium]
MNNLSWFTKWYANQICKNTGTPLNINISTIENSAWCVKIDLKQTPYSKIVLKKLTKIKSDYNWFSIEIKNKEFLAEGD